MPEPGQRQFRSATAAAQLVLRFEDVDLPTTRAAYSELLRGDLTQYAAFQDFMVRRLFRLAGELDLPLQIHASFGGPSSKLDLLHNQPALLEPNLSQPYAEALTYAELGKDSKSMAWAVSNAKVEPRGNALMITKQTAGAAKIDPLIALFNAVALMGMNPEAICPRSVYEDRGILIF